DTTETSDECIERHFRKFCEVIKSFPTTSQFSEATQNAINECIEEFARLSLDDRLMQLVEYEYRLFRLVERQVCQHEIVRPFKDRWRQVLNEGKRIPKKHILTIQPGISLNQLNEMSAADVTLVVPKRLHKEYPQGSGTRILTLEEFVSAIRALNLPSRAKPGE